MYTVHRPFSVEGVVLEIFNNDSMFVRERAISGPRIHLHVCGREKTEHSIDIHARSTRFLDKINEIHLTKLGVFPKHKIIDRYG